MIRIEELQEMKKFLERISNVKLIRILSLTSFSRAFSDHFSHNAVFDFDLVLSELKKDGVEKRELLNLCKLCDFFFRGKKRYAPILRDNKFSLLFDYASNYDTRFVSHSVFIKSNFLDLDKIVGDKLGEFIEYDKVSKDEIIIRSCRKCSNILFAKSELKNYINDNFQQVRFVGEEKDLDVLMENFEVVSKDFSSIIEVSNILDYVKLILTLLPSEIKQAKSVNFTQNKMLIKFFVDNHILCLSQLLKLKFLDIDIELAKELAKIFDNNYFILPREIHDLLINSLKEKDQEYCKLRYYHDMTYNDIGTKLGVTRAGAQAAIVKIKERLLNPKRYAHLIRLYKQLLLFRENDYFISSKIIEDLGLWKGLFIDVFGLREYKKSSLYIIENDVKSFCYNDIDQITFEDRDKEVVEYEFEFIKNLPNIIKVNELSKYKESIIENTIGNIFQSDLDKLIDLNFVSYKTILSKTKLNVRYFLKQIIQTYYPGEFDVNDENILNKISSLLNSMYGFSLDIYNNKYISGVLSSFCLHTGRASWKFVPDQVELSQEMKDKINEYITSYPIPAVPIKNIYEQFAVELLDFGIENKYGLHDLLKQFITKYKITRDYIYTDDSQTYVEIIADFIKKSDCLVTKEVLENHFPGFNLGVMQRVVNTSSIVNMNGYYTCIDSFNLTQEEINGIKEELDYIVQDNESHNTKNIFFRLKNKFNGLFNRIGITHYLQFYYIANKLFDDYFEFLRPFIAKKGIEIQDKETQLIELIVGEVSVSIDRLRELSAFVGFFLDSVMDLVIRNNDEIVFLDENTVGAINKIELDEEKIIEIDTILDKFMLNYNCRYLKDLSKDKEIKEIVPFSNEWFLYSIISAYSTKYKVVRTCNVMSRTELILVTEDFDIRELDKLSSSNLEVYDLEDLLDIEDFE